MKQFKICVLGAPMVGKTSLVQRFVYSRFSEKYHSTIGVKIDKKPLTIGDEPVQLIVWDVQGEDRYRKVLPSYLRGMSGYLLVVDVTRAETVEVARRLRGEIGLRAHDMPFLVLGNKSDLAVPETASRPWAIDGALAVVATSARSGIGVEESFRTLAESILERRSRPDAA